MAWGFSLFRKRGFNPIARWHEFTGPQRSTFVRLGIATLLVYASTVWGITILGAPIFNVIDYAGMPLVTILAGQMLLRDHVAKRDLLWSLLGSMGVIVLFWAISQNGTAKAVHGSIPTWIGFGLAILSTVATSYSSALQKKQIHEERLLPDEVLLFRFPLSALAMTVWLICDFRPCSVQVVLGLIVVAIIGVFLPLLLLCFGFMQASLGQFAKFLLLIPVLTWVIVPALITEEASRIADPKVLIGSGILVLAFIGSQITAHKT